MDAREKKRRQRQATAEMGSLLANSQGSRKDGGMTVHDLRALHACEICGGVGFRMPMTTCIRDSRGRKRSATYAHPSCYVHEHGADAYLNLPREEALKATLGHDSLMGVGPVVMKKLLHLVKEDEK